MKKTELKDRLVEAMKIRGMTSTELVEKTGIPNTTISYYRNGKTVPRSDNLYRIAEALNINEAWLLGYDVPMGRSDAQKKNDLLAKLIVKMRTDEDFYETVAALAGLSETKYQSVKQLLNALNE